MTDKKETKGTWLTPALMGEIEARRASHIEVAFLADVLALQTKERGCFRLNKAFGDRHGVSTKRASAIISDLAARGYIVVETIRNAAGQVEERQIWLGPKFPLDGSERTAAGETTRKGILKSEVRGAPTVESVGKDHAPAVDQTAEKCGLHEGGEQPQASTQVPPQRKAELARVTKSTASPLADPAAAFHAAMAGRAVDEPIAVDPPSPVRAEDEDLPFGDDPLDDYTKAQIAYHSMNRAAQSARWSAHG
ncbi:hypothetical protein SAMN02787142_4322 [Burkholderia sp. WP9]|uniref:hypothetical protein n=1 Tax=Burkholderia sp. WP9 TaxID=1500263 RepID=UPI00089A5A49|nr:hypothetical protein [Burkholderia sp. WP9]SEE00621.1 hypothetical protein SAMN02787142_4322 [Burkholderia sp. WP9]